jgi:hypothetical protein
MPAQSVMEWRGEWNCNHLIFLTIVPSVKLYVPLLLPTQDSLEKTGPGNGLYLCVAGQNPPGNWQEAGVTACHAWEGAAGVRCRCAVEVALRRDEARKADSRRFVQVCRAGAGDVFPGLAGLGDRNRAGGFMSTAIDRIAALFASAFGKAGISYGFFRQMALRQGRGWPCSSYAVLTST